MHLRRHWFSQQPAPFCAWFPALVFTPNPARPPGTYRTQTPLCPLTPRTDRGPQQRASCTLPLHSTLSARSTARLHDPAYMHLAAHPSPHLTTSTAWPRLAPPANQHRTDRRWNGTRHRPTCIASPSPFLSPPPVPALAGHGRTRRPPRAPPDGHPSIGLVVPATSPLPP